MKTNEVRELSPKELKVHISDKQEELANLKFQLSLHQLDNTAKVREARRELAKLLTIQKEHESGIRPLIGSDSE